MNQPEIDLVQLQKTATVNRQVINRLKERVSLLENALGLVCEDSQMGWLYRNRSERMDATVPMFPKSRADFHLARYEFAARRVAGKTVADIACGTGYGVRILSQQGATTVVGIDVCQQAIDYARAKHQLDNCTFVVADATATGLDAESLDVVTSFETIEHVTNERALVSEFARVLKPGGTLICSTPNSWPLEIAPHHLRVYDVTTFLKALVPHFEVSQMFNQNSGSDFKYNHNQPAAIIPSTESNQDLAECFIAIATKK